MNLLLLLETLNQYLLIATGIGCSRLQPWENFEFENLSISEHFSCFSSNFNNQARFLPTILQELDR
jgi:hypothetical protein